MGFARGRVKCRISTHPSVGGELVAMVEYRNSYLYAALTSSINTSVTP